MDGLNLTSSPEHLFRAWESFVGRHRLLSGIHPLISASWERCWPILDPHNTRPLKQLSAGHLLSTQVTYFDLLSIARPIMEDIHQYIEFTNTVVILVNSAGYVLEILGDAIMVELANSQGIVVGAVLSESQMGTNAFALALIERIPVQVCAHEHYLKQFHIFHTAAAPIFALEGALLGCLGILRLAEDKDSHSLGLVMAGARAIETQRQADILVGERNTQLTSLNAILSSISEGILVWDQDNIVIHANTAASEILGVKRDELMGRRINDVLELPILIEDSILKQEALDSVELHLGVRQRSLNCIASLRYVRNRHGIESTILILRRTQDVRQLVQKQVGADAFLTLDNLIGESAEIRKARRLASTAAFAKASVLLRGASGTGKNMLARAIHNHGPSRDGPFVVFACTSIPSEMLLVELVGSEEGVSSLRRGSRPSKFELADGGTIFFKDIEVLPLEAQSILVTVIELGIVQRLGSTRPIEVDVRVIASAADDLEQRLEEGSFRADLYYRLSPFEIRLPALRERLDDLPLLVKNILERLNRLHETHYRLDETVMPLLAGYDWPGNIRELEAILGRAALQAGGDDVILPAHLPEHVRYPQIGQRKFERVTPLQDSEREAILKAARVYHGNVSKMARQLGISRTTLWRRLRTYQLDPHEFRV